MTTTTNSDKTLTLADYVFLLFLSLKLAGVGEPATWSWWWITAPIWGVMLFKATFGKLLERWLFNLTMRRAIRNIYRGK